MNVKSIKKDDLEIVRSACASLRTRLRNGEAATVEMLLEEHPSLADNEEALLELIHVELMTRDDLGQKPTLEEWEERFPRLLAKMERIISFRSLFGSEMPTVADPQASQGLPVSLAPSSGRLPQIGNYQILQEIGRGGMGVVYRARHPQLSRNVAIKMILTGEHAGIRERMRLKNEADATAQIEHPHVVKIYDVGEHDGLPYLVMEYVAGGTLTRMIHGMPQAFRWSARLIEILADAIHEAHKRNIVHRDLNPSNILMAIDGTPKISDFGLAKFLVSDQGVSLNGVILGTPSYMAPEQVSNKERVEIGPWTDVYALGAILYEMLTGTAPFRGLTPMETLCQVVDAELVPPSRLRHGMPEDLETICLKCLERDPSRRYASALELSEDLKRYNDNQPIHARRSSRFRRTVQWIRRQPVVASLLGLSALLLFSLLGVTSTYSIYITKQNRELEIQHDRIEYNQAILAVNRSKFERDANSALRLTYDAVLNQVKQSLEQGRYELALSQFEDLRARLQPSETTGFEWRYLDHRLEKAIRVLTGGDANVTGLAVSPGGEFLVSGTEDGEIRLWPLTREGSTQLVAPRQGQVSRLAIHSEADDRPVRVASVFHSRTQQPVIEIWDVSSRTLTATLEAPVADAHDLSFSTDGRRVSLTSSTGEEILTRSWTWAPATETWEPEPIDPTAPPTALAVSRDGTLHAEGFPDGTVRLTNNSQPVTLESRDGGKVLCLAFSRDGSRLAAGREDYALTIWDLKTGKVLAHDADHQGPVKFVAFCPNGEALIGQAGDRVFWKQPTIARKTRQQLAPADSRIRLITTSDDGRLVAIAAEAGSITLWDVAEAKVVGTYWTEANAVKSLVFSPKGDSLLIACDDPRIRIWRFHDDPERMRAIKAHAAEVWTLALSPDGKLLASGADDDSIKLWDVKSRKELLTLRGHEQTVSSIVIYPPPPEDPDATRDPKLANSEQLWLASVGLDGKTLLWKLHQDQATGTVTAVKTILAEENDRLRSVTVSPDSRRLAVAGTKGVITIWDLANNQVQSKIRGHDAPIHSLLYSPNPSVLASASGDETVRLWDADSGSENATELLKFPGEMRAIAFSSDNRFMAMSGFTGHLSLYAMDEWKIKSSLKDHPKAVRCLAFAPDSQTLATGCDDGNVRLWDLKSSQILYTLRGHRTRVNALAFSLDGNTLVSCDHHGVIRFWDATPAPPPDSPGL